MNYDAPQLGHFANGRWSKPSMAQMAEDVADEHRLTVADLKGDCRRRPVSRARQELMHRIYATGLFSLPQIGHFLGDRDHTTVLWGVRSHERRSA